MDCTDFAMNAGAFVFGFVLHNTALCALSSVDQLQRCSYVYQAMRSPTARKAAVDEGLEAAIAAGEGAGRQLA
eukprot:scaffold544596_cov14-Prasinocladus_malaysianus.AAC.1